MTIAKVSIKDRELFNSLASHPLQAWEWGEFRKKTGVEVYRLGKYENNKLVETAQITVHPLPHTKWKIGYFPKGKIPGKEMLSALYDLGRKENCIFIKLEPNIQKDTKILGYYDTKRNDRNIKSFNILISQYPNIVQSPHPLFTKYTFQLDLAKSEEELLKNMSSKTRYNVRIAQKHEVIVKEDNSGRAFDEYLKLTFETTRRQKFYAHNRKYHECMWQELKPSFAHLLTASYSENGNDHILVAWIVFLFNNILYYPYGASSSLFRNVMASNLMMWEVIRWGKRNGASIFDMWGSLGPSPDPHDPWYGFHRFKEGYGAKLVEFMGSYDLVINPLLYKLYNNVYKLRNIFLKMKDI